MFGNDTLNFKSTQRNVNIQDPRVSELIESIQRKYCGFRLTGGKPEVQVAVSSLLVLMLTLQLSICDALSPCEIPVSCNSSFCCLFMLASICSSDELSLSD